MSGYTYNDREMLLASQIAYLNMPPSSNIPGEDTSVNLGSLVDEILSAYGVQGEDGSWSIRPEYAKDPVKSSQFWTAKDVMTVAGELDSWRNWTVVDSCNKNDSSGFCACVIDTGDGNALIGFRGSESTSFYEGVMDWGVADVGLLNSSLTIQQADAEAYLREIWEKYGDRYNSYSLTGHSLGGNLAEHATITAPDEMRAHIDHCISYDGPGYSNEYLRIHRRDIEEAEGTIDHYWWSWVGNLLIQPDGVNNRVIDAQDEPGKEGTIEGMLLRHKIINAVIDGDDAQDGETSWLVELLGPTSRLIEWAGPVIFLWLPIVREIELLNQFISGIKAIIDEIKRGIEDRKAEITKFFSDLYNYAFGSSDNCEYEIETTTVSSVAEELSRIAIRMNRISDEIDDIVGRIPFYSVAGAYYKSKIRSISRGIDQDAERFRKCASNGNSAVSSYINADVRAADRYA